MTYPHALRVEFILGTAKSQSEQNWLKTVGDTDTIWRLSKKYFVCLIYCFREIPQEELLADSDPWPHHCSKHRDLR